ncbi:MAG TPA: hypothetical protein VG519_13215 [Pseudochrobactrum sp.]|nr:hypothetical protein [Pseudochrobactrum sp.]
MAQAFLRAQEIADIAVAEIARLDDQYEKDVEAGIKKYEGQASIRGFLWWRHIHHASRQEAEDIFYGRNSDCWWSPADKLQEKHSRRVGSWMTIKEAALGALERGDKKVLLDAADIARIRKATPLTQ